MIVYGVGIVDEDLETDLLLALVGGAQESVRLVELLLDVGLHRAAIWAERER